MANYEIFETKERILADNDAAASQLRRQLRAQGVYFVNLMASPGSGKTTLLLALIERLKDKLKIGVMEADVDSDVDAAKMQSAGVKTIQLHTGGLCHMDADMTSRAVERLNASELDLLVLENIGNLVCPAEFDVGSDLNLMILSVPEGDDKPLKYPLMFKVSDVMVVNKMDTLPAFDFDIEKAAERARALNPAIEVFPVSARTGEGVDALAEFLLKKVNEKRAAL